jgi:hypothetical protein
VKRQRRRLTPLEFDVLLPLLDISADRRAAARAALVDGRTFSSIASQYGWRPQAVNGAVTVVWRMRERYRQSQRMIANAERFLPPGWELVSLVVPSHLVPQIRAEILADALKFPLLKQGG